MYHSLFASTSIPTKASRPSACYTNLHETLTLNSYFLRQKITSFTRAYCSVKMSKIPQRVKEPSSYAKIFAKHKANQSKKDEIVDELQTPESTTKEGPSGSAANVEGPHGLSGVQHGTSRVPLYATNHFHGKYNLGCTAGDSPGLTHSVTPGIYIEVIGYPQ